MLVAGVIGLVINHQQLLYSVLVQIVEHTKYWNGALITTTIAAILSLKLA